MDVALFSESTTPKSTLKKSSHSTERLGGRKKAQGTSSITRNNTPRRKNNEEKIVSPVHLRRSGRKRNNASRGNVNDTKRTKRNDSQRDVVPNTAYQLPQFTDNEIDWANMSPPQSKFQLTRTPVKRIDNEMDDGELREEKLSDHNDITLNDVTLTVNIKHVISEQPVTGHVVVDNEVTIVTSNDDNSNSIASTQHSEVVQSSSNNSILIPSNKEDVINLPATLQCTDNDLSYLERMANIKLLKELTHKSSQLDRELKSVKQEVEEITYKCQKADEEYATLSATHKRTAIMVHHFLNNKHLDTIPEVSTEQLQATGDVTLDKETIEQLQQAHKLLKVQLQTASRSLEKKKAMLEKQKEQNKETVEKTAALQAEKKQLMTKLKEMDQQEDKLRGQITSLQQQQQLSDKNHEEQNSYYMKQLEMLKERCKLYKQREENMKQIKDYMDDLELSTKLRQQKIYHLY